MPATRVRLHAVSGTIVVSAEERDDVGVGADAVREVVDLFYFLEADIQNINAAQPKHVLGAGVTLFIIIPQTAFTDDLHSNHAFAGIVDAFEHRGNAAELLDLLG